jgi:hypothetical protein
LGETRESEQALKIAFSTARSRAENLSYAGLAVGFRQLRYGRPSAIPNRFSIR